MSGPGIERSAAIVNPHHCFGCGELNRHGLQLRFTPDPDGNGVSTQFCPSPRVEGYPGVVHGGILTTVLDEVMAWSLYRHEIWAATGALTTRYRQPVRIGETTQAVGYMLRDRRRVLEMRGEIRRLADGAVLAEATATFVRVSEEQAIAWQRRYQRVPSGTPGQDGG